MSLKNVHENESHNNTFEIKLHLETEIIAHENKHIFDMLNKTNICDKYWGESLFCAFWGQAHWG